MRTSASELAGEAEVCVPKTALILSPGRTGTSFLARYLDASHSGLREMCHILGPDYREAGAAVSPSERIRPGRPDALPPWREWSREQCGALQQICGPLMREFGYSDEPEWRARVSGHG